VNSNKEINKITEDILRNLAEIKATFLDGYLVQKQ